MERLLTLREASEVLNLSASAAGRLSDSGKLPSVRVAGLKKVLFRPADIEVAVKAVDHSAEN